MSKVKNRDRKQKAAGHADHSVRDNRASTVATLDAHAGDSPVLTPTAVSPSSSRKKERRYGHN